MARMRAPDRRRQLLEVAAGLFAERGFWGTTTAELAAEAGITEPILYRHFDNKLDLFVSLIGEIGREVIDAWKAELAAHDDPHERLRVILAGNPATHERGRGVYRLIFQAMTDLDGDPKIASAIKRHLSSLRSFLRDELAALQDAGAVRTDKPAATLADLLISTGIGYGMVAALSPSGAGSSAAKSRMQQLLDELLIA